MPQRDPDRQPLPLPPIDETVARLVAADADALDGVARGHGGPFGAGLVVYVPTPDGGTMPILLGEDHNRVLASGFAGAHAEHNVLVGTARRLREVLSDHRGALVVLYSSGESCAACRAKEEIAARRLIADGLLAPGNFAVAYGATYADAFELAGFNDGPYLEDIARPAGERAIACTALARADLPASVPAPWRTQAAPWAGVLASDGTWLCGAVDGRSDTAWFARPELGAIAAASALRQASGSATPWDLQGATLVTSSPAPVGPLTYATAQWANVGRILSCTDGPAAAHDASGIDDRAFFEVIAGGHEHPLSALRVVAVKAARPLLRAQRQWGESLANGSVPQEKLYNGRAAALPAKV